ncbi:exocyst complex component exo84 [Coemansia sp. RSA 1813]|nr:exocyst complex component exo84 [Coemansia sp. RSA 1646]KAJ1773928.1 exocyst complex component exo84 [Coemansia sp. RSA 1843]KAJ2089353.1 exocyst complex component exo84 [Coemansia sp. RSA 986]KAJ2214455.1 exocyst complex component exo84 [Coemansia sp. RSA 487]KAJ2569324.1 exocyst complex component exo84 [Coemansia sp. RSA 1813]
MNVSSRRKSLRRGVPMGGGAAAESSRAKLDPSAFTQSSSDSQNDLPNVSLSKLTKSDFRPEDYLKETLRSVDEGGIRQFRKTLEESRRVASKNLQKNVYKNYESFVFISKEISSMERDMQMLRELLQSINQIGDHLMDEDEQSILDADEPAAGAGAVGAGRVLGRRRTMRMSMANQHDMFKEQLAKVWRAIRDAQKFVPFAPNRHVVGDVRNISELSPSTLQIRQRVDIVVFSDMLLLAVRKKRANHAQIVLVADRSFVLSDATVTDVSDSSRSGHLVKIVNRAETFLFGFRDADSKNELLMLIGHARAGIFGSDMQAMPPLPGARGNGPSAPPARQGKSRQAAASPGDDESEGMSGELKQRVDEMMDSLDIHIARREFKNAVALVQRLKGVLGEAQKAPASASRAVEAHTTELARLVLADLLIPCSARKQVAGNIALLHKLGWDKEAKEAFLVSRSATVKNRTRQLKLEGNTRLYIRELAIVYFRLIRNTCEWYSEFFTDSTMISALIAWVRQEMAGYAVIFRRHVFHEMQKFQVIASCLNHTLAEVDILGHAGLDLKFMLDQEFFPDLTSCIRGYEARSLALLTKIASEDPLAVASKISTANNENAARIFGPQIPIIASVSKLDEVLTEFGNELRHIVRDSLYGQVVASVLAIIEGVLKQFLTILRKGDNTHAQEFALLVSTQAVVTWVIPRAAAHLDKIFGRTVTDIHNLEQRLEAFPTSLQDVFCQKHSVAVAKTTFDFVTADFDRTGEVTDAMTPSPQMEQLLRRLGEIARELDQWSPLSKRTILSGIIDCLFVQMISHRNWETANGEKRKFSHYGVHCLVLDVHFLLRICGSLVTKSTNNMANRVCEKALRSYFTANSGSTTKQMMNKSWYDARVLETMQRLGFAFPDFGKGFEHRSQQSFEANGATSGESKTPKVPQLPPNNP